jgi:8-oxo-dGTP pyrophosphatase MutT (NUDIX family)
VIRPIAICVVRRDDRILVFESRDRVKDQTSYRPLGGGINFGERGADAIVREMREEINAEISRPVYLATLENIFTLNGEPHHEFVQVYEAHLLDERLYTAARLTVQEENGDIMPAMWKSLDEFRRGAATLYPDGLMELLQA